MLSCDHKRGSFYTLGLGLAAIYDYTNTMKIWFASLILVLSVFACGAKAAAADPFTVVGIPVDATAPNAIQAQTLALQDGQARAAKLLLERVTLPGVAATLPPLSAEDVGRMIRAMEVNNERRSANRYLGDISVAFNPRQVQSFLRTNNQTLVTTQARERLLIPIYDGFRGVGENALQAAFANDRYAHSLTPIKAVPTTELIDVLGFDPTMRDYSAEELAPLGPRYGVDGALIVRGGSGGSVTATDVSFSQNTQSSLSPTYGVNIADAVAQLIAQMETNWKQASATTSGQSVTTTVSILYSSQNEWQRLQRAINTSAQISDARLDALSKDGALMTITYGGDLDKLGTELRYKGVAMRQEPTGLVMTRG